MQIYLLIGIINNMSRFEELYFPMYLNNNRKFIHFNLVEKVMYFRKSYIFCFCETEICETNKILYMSYKIF